tara:strand:+ start:487 stop:705 length:219 start_codon:yes stop_codon:yes gene_type:complete
MNRYSSRNDWYKDPSDAYEVGKNWCISVPYHDLKIMDEARNLAKKKNCKSVAQFVRKVIWKEIYKNKELVRS